MAEPMYSVKEIIELQFKNLSKEMTEIKDLLKDQNVQFEKRFASIEKDIDELHVDSARYKTIWGIGATVGASVIAFALNRFL